MAQPRHHPLIFRPNLGPEGPQKNFWTPFPPPLSVRRLPDSGTVGLCRTRLRDCAKDCANSFTSKILSRPSRGRGILKGMGVGGVGENGVHVGLSEFLAQNTAK